MFGGIVKHKKNKLLLAPEGAGDIMALITWVVFGAFVVGHSLDYLTWQIVLYAVLSLTLIRMLPVFLVLIGMNVKTNEKLLMGWFGTRGLASIVFDVIVLDKNLPNGNIITTTVVCTVVLSVIAHGLSANPLVAALARRE